jgi:uncharacterized metal-binding protein YceD (DUF177 family)
MKPLCSEDCTGITLEKQGTTARKPEENDEAIDPRWEALKKLKSKN